MPKGTRTLKRELTDGPNQETAKKIWLNSATVEHFFDESPWGARVSVARPEGLEPPTF
jgi:hypothetical protein